MPSDVTTQAAPVRTEVKLGEDTFLSDDFLRQLIDVGEVDILVGVPTYNNQKTISSVVEVIQAGILRFFPRERAVIINADGGSRDGTPETVTNAAIDDVRRAPNLYTLRTLHAISTRYANSPSSGGALRTILAASELLRAKACAVIDPEMTHLDVESLPNLLRPIYRQGMDLVLPSYRRHKFDGLLVSNLLYPMTRAIYRVRIREPFATEFALSGSLGSQFLVQNSWNDELRGTSPEIPLTLAAITGNCRIDQVFLGQRERADRRSADLVPALRSTVGLLFSCLGPDFPFWSAQMAHDLPRTNAGHEFDVEPLRINRKRLFEMYVRGIAELQSVFHSILSPSTLGQLQQIAGLTEDEFQYPAELWVRTVYEFAASYFKSVINRDHIIQALAPLFRGRAFTFVTENRNATPDEVARGIEELCLEFEKQRPYLLELWKSKP